MLHYRKFSLKYLDGRHDVLGYDSIDFHVGRQCRPVYRRLKR